MTSFFERNSLTPYEHETLTLLRRINERQDHLEQLMNALIMLFERTQLNGQLSLVDACIKTEVENETAR